MNYYNQGFYPNYQYGGNQYQATYQPQPSLQPGFNEITHAAMFSYDVNLTIDQEELIADIIATYGDEIIYITNKVFRKMKREE